MADQTTTPKPELTEVANILRGNDWTQGFVEPMRLLIPTDMILRQRAAGDYRIYQEILRDDQVHSTFQQRRRAVVSRPWIVTAGGDRPVDKAAADDLTEQLKGIEFDAVTDKMLFGMFYGFAVGECMWEQDGGRVRLASILVRNRRRFRFAGDKSLRLLTMKNFQGDPLPERKFWYFSTGGDHDDDPYGLGLAHFLYWPVLFKRGDIRFWLTFIEKFAAPTSVGKYPASATEEEKSLLLKAASAVQTDAAVIVPDTMALELLEAARSGSIDQAAFYDKMDAAISKINLSQTMTTDSGSSLSQSETHAGVKLEVVKGDSDFICASFNAGPARWLTEWNFPGAAVPIVGRKIDAVEDLTARATRDKLIFDMGFRPTVDYIKNTYGGEWEFAPAPPPQPNPFAPAPAFAENVTKVGDAPVKIASKVDDAASTAMNAMIDAIKTAVVGAKDWSAAKAQLDALTRNGSLDSSALAEVLASGLVTANLQGRVEVGPADSGGTDD